MKNILITVLLAIPFSLFSQEMNIISFNIRLNTENDGINAWPNRAEMATGLLRYHEADIFGLQEALYGQISDIQDAFPEYKWIGVGRDDGDKKGEFCPVFYNPSKFILLKNGNFWLSETPEKPGLGWDAACNRIVTWGHFKSKITGKQFMVFNTHFDHRGKLARKNSAILIRNKIEEMTYNKNIPVILTGDLNLTPDELPVSLIRKYLSDSHDISETPPYGPVGTYNGFKIDAEMKNRIDYIFVHGNIKVLKYAALSDSKNKRFPSDHLPVFVKVRLK
jgi:endonuclease/exonuclease/phosphatase family metal-dependent hydrolase